ncbi:S10 family peptidase [Sphingomonas yantingensis]|uniref:Carboxypeptidase C (Cathepsin A) n=1 Tax=Sphingomonas yantingensis TaxID=1241761 RepID=A0A7W9AMF6_9SPHN|nr:peptidase S10 [Sphingomonas yantingensis]MBB5697164.1 carboxypeptidase C (cathepsin A) [Sphingomonas yantingensis]
MSLRTFACLAALAIAAPLAAQDKPAAKDDAADAAIPAPVRSVTRHSGSFGGTRIAYRAIAGDTYLKDKDGKPLASITSYSYIKEGPVDPNRPVTFLWNGGPGSGSLWLQMGAFGPKRVVIPSDARDDGAPPYPMVDNAESLLDVTDLVFIDPVGTGFSRALGKTDPKDYWGITKDARSMAAFIRLWLNENGRWNAPKFIGGESYGTTRSAAVIKELEGSYTDVAINGIILISSILDFSQAADTPGNELGYVTNLPSMAATAWYHDKVPNKPATVEAFVEEARQFAIGPYAAALLKGNSLSAQERQQILPQLSRFTGVNQTYLAQADLRLSPSRFYKELLRDQGKVIGRLDTRYTGRDYDNAGETPDNDPSFYAIDGAYTAAMNQWSREGLKYSPDLTYSSIGGVRDWDWNIGEGPRGGSGYLNVAPWIGTAMRENSGLRVFVGQGYYDFATPFFGAEYSLNRTGIPNDGRIVWKYYNAGHMMYVREDDLRKLSSDIRAFIRAR